MHISKNLIIVIESAIIIVMLGLLVYYSNSSTPSLPTTTLTSGLLAQRIYLKTIEPQNHFIYNLKPLKESMTRRIEENNLNISVYVANMRTGVEMGINENIGFNPVSLNKLPIAVAILRRIERGELSFDTSVTINQKFVNSESGSLYSHIGENRSVRQLLHDMLSESDNTATLTLLDMVPFSEIQFLSDYWGYYNPSPFEKDLSSDNKVFIVTPRSTYAIFTSLYFSSILTQKHSEYLLSELTNTSYDIKKFANLPADVVVAQKYGEYYLDNRDLFHSCGIMYMQDARFFYCIMTRDISFDKAQEEVGLLVNDIYRFVQDNLKKDLKI